MKIQLITSTGEVREADTTGMRRSIIAGSPSEAPSLLSRLTDSEARALCAWLSASQAGCIGVNFNADSLAGALPPSINLAEWPGWAGVAVQFQMNLNAAWIQTNELIDRLRATGI